MEPLFLGECFCALSAPYCDFTVSLAEFAAHMRQRNWIIFCRGVYLAENTSQAASVEFVRRRRTNYARSSLQNPVKKPRRGFLTGWEAPWASFLPPGIPCILYGFPLAGEASRPACLVWSCAVMTICKEIPGQRKTCCPGVFPVSNRIIRIAFG